MPNVHVPLENTQGAKELDAAPVLAQSLLPLAASEGLVSGLAELAQKASWPLS